MRKNSAKFRKLSTSIFSLSRDSSLAILWEPLTASNMWEVDRERGKREGLEGLPSNVYDSISAGRSQAELEVIIEGRIQPDCGIRMPYTPAS